MREAVVLSVFWFLALGGLGTYFPFYSLYLNENLGLSAARVGMIMALPPLVGMLVQPAWGHLADRTGARARVLGVIAAGAAVFYVALTVARGATAVLVGTALLATCSTAVIPMAVSTTLALVRPLGPHAFGLVRAWGTIGFFVAVVGFPKLLASETFTAAVAALPPSLLAGGAEGSPASQPLLGAMLPVTGLLVALAALVTLALPPAGSSVERASKGDWRALLGNGPFLRLLGFTFFAFFFLQGPMALFPLFVRARGGGLDTVSTMWVFMLLLEVPLIALSGAGLARVGPRGLVAIGIVAGAARWIVSAVSPDLRVVYAVQVLHGVTVTGLVIGAPLYVEAVVPPRLRATGQGVLAMAGVSFGGILSNLTAGRLMEWGGAGAPALYGGVGAALLAIALPWILPRPAHVAIDPEAIEAVPTEV